MPKAVDLFDPVRPERELHPAFLKMKDSPLWAPARAVLRELFAEFVDPDGNFVDQFQTAGFDARTFEIYLFALFREGGFTVDRSYKSPDFYLSKKGEQIGVEAVTANPRGTVGIKPYLPLPKERNADQTRAYLADEVPIRLGSPLFSKLQKKYWNLPQVKGRPFLLAIESFHEDGSLAISSTPLVQYLFGLSHHWYHDAKGELVITTEPLDAHRLGAKEVPSGFFRQPETENISAVLFSNSGTGPKFNRMGQEGRYRSYAVRMIRYGTCYRHDPNSDLPAGFVYEVGDGEAIEKWCEGTVLIHNPYARYPVTPGLMGVDAEEKLEEGRVVTTFFGDGFHPYSSLTMMFPGDTPTPALQRMVNKIARALKKQFPEP